MYIWMLLTYLCSLKADVLCSQKKPQELTRREKQTRWVKAWQIFYPTMCLLFFKLQTVRWLMENSHSHLWRHNNYFYYNKNNFYYKIFVSLSDKNRSVLVAKEQNSFQRLEWNFLFHCMECRLHIWNILFANANKTLGFFSTSLNTVVHALINLEKISWRQIWHSDICFINLFFLVTTDKNHRDEYVLGKKIKKK